MKYTVKAVATLAKFNRCPVINVFQDEDDYGWRVYRGTDENGGFKSGVVFTNQPDALSFAEEVVAIDPKYFRLGNTGE